MLYFFLSFVILNVVLLSVMFCHAECSCAEFLILSVIYAKCRICILSVVMLNVVLLNVVLLNVMFRLLC